MSEFQPNNEHDKPDFSRAFYDALDDNHADEIDYLSIVTTMSEFIADSLGIDAIATSKLIQTWDLPQLEEFEDDYLTARNRLALTIFKNMVEIYPYVTDETDYESWFTDMVRNTLGVHGSDGTDCFDDIGGSDYCIQGLCPQKAIYAYTMEKVLNSEWNHLEHDAFEKTKALNTMMIGVLSGPGVEIMDAHDEAGVLGYYHDWLDQRADK